LMKAAAGITSGQPAADFRFLLRSLRPPNRQDDPSGKKRRPGCRPAPLGAV
jgi:hypothetical protein